MSNLPYPGKAPSNMEINHELQYVTEASNALFELAQMHEMDLSLK